MKKIFWIIIVFFSSVIVFAEEQNFERFIYLVRETAKFPDTTLTLSSDFSCNCIKIIDEMTPEDREAYYAATKAECELQEFSSAKIFAFTMRAMEENTFKGEKCALRSAIHTNEEMQKYDFSVLGKACDLMIEKRWTENSPNKSQILFVWFDHRNDSLRNFNISIPWLWYEGRKYIQQMWNDWYNCWKLELKRELPRSFILKALSDEAKSYTFFFYPYVYEAIKKGDKMLEKYFKDFYMKDLSSERKYESFVIWWERNKDECALPLCEGFEEAMERLKGKKTAYTDQNLAYIRDWSTKSRKYYTNPPEQPDYWYYRLKDDYNYDDADAESQLEEAKFPPSGAGVEGWRPQKIVTY